MFQSRLFRVFGFACTLSAVAAPALADPPGAQTKPTQYVLISFDGAHDLAQWRRSRTLAKQTGAKFTYFLSCVFLLSPETRKTYHPPHRKAGASNVGFATSKDEVEQRLYQIRLAVAEGNELASHGCGHFDGATWSKADWLSEFASFRRILSDAYKINGIAGQPTDWDKVTGSVRGFRAPYLSANKALYQALAEDGFAFDVSGVLPAPALPQRASQPARFALPQIPEGPKQRRVIAMDYNLFARHSGAKEQPDKDGAFEARTLAAFRAAFDEQYKGQRIPLQLGFHFVLMNGGAYWRALEHFAEDVCSKPDVACVTYSDYLKRTSTAGDQHAGR